MKLENIIHGVLPGNVNTGKTTAGVPNTYTQAKSNRFPVGYRHPKFADAEHVSERTADAEIIAQLRNELQDAEDRIEQLETELEAARRG